MNYVPKPIPSLGLYPYTFAAEEIGNRLAFSAGAKTSLSLTMARAIRLGELQVRDPETGAPFAVTFPMNNPSPYVTIGDINRWLELKGFTYTWIADDPSQLDTAQLAAEDKTLQQEVDKHIDQPASNSKASFETLKQTAFTKKQILLFEWPGTVNIKGGLSDVPKWLESARVTKGKRGRGGSARWDPAQIAICLLTEKNISQGALARHIKTHYPDSISDWQEALELLNTRN